MEIRLLIEATEGGGEGPERTKDDFRFRGWRILGVMGCDEMGDNRSHPRFDGWWKTRGGGQPARYRQKRRRTAADRSTGRIEEGG